MTRFTSKYDAGVHVNEDEFLSLHRNENLFVGTDWTVDAARELAGSSGIASYPDPTSRPVREALADFHGVTPENVFVGNGSDEVLADLLHLLRDTYDAVHVLDVHFKVYPMLAERMKFRLETLPGNTFETGRIEVQDFRGLGVVDSPNGITGSRLPRDEILALADHENSFLIWDSAYGEYCGDEPPPQKRNIMLVRSFSKFYALAGLRVGYCIGDAELVEALHARKDAFNVNGMAQAMALEALRRHDYFQSLLKEMLGCREQLVARLRALGLRVHEPAGIAVLGTHPEVSGEVLQRELLAKKVAVRRFLDPVLENHIRMTVPPKEGVDRLIQALTEVLDEQRH